MSINRVGFIGAGNVADAMIRGIIISGCLDPGQIIVSDVDQDRLLAVHRSLGPVMARNNRDATERADILFLSVKPNLVEAVASEIRDVLRPEQYVVSVAAGKSLAKINAALGDLPKSCRIMPNLSAKVRKSIIGLFAEESVSTEELNPVFALLSQIGRVFRIEDESLMAVITALSGSAPAYYVMMADALIEYGISQGLPREMATDMILGTMQGSAAWAANAKVPLKELWQQVVTPGGTTEAGINYYRENGFLDIFLQGLDRSTRRAREMGDK